MKIKFGTMACACHDTSVLDLLEHDKHTNKSKFKQTKKRSVAEQITSSLFCCYFKWLVLNDLGIEYVLFIYSYHALVFCFFLAKNSSKKFTEKSCYRVSYFF